MQSETKDDATYEWAKALAAEDIISAARDFFDLCPELRELIVALEPDGSITVNGQYVVTA